MYYAFVCAAIYVYLLSLRRMHTFAVTLLSVCLPALIPLYKLFTEFTCVGSSTELLKKARKDFMQLEAELFNKSFNAPHLKPTI